MLRRIDLKNKKNKLLQTNYSKSHEKKQTELRFTFFNATSIGSTGKWRQFLSYIIFQNYPQIIMIAETWFDKNSIKCLKIVEDKLFNDQYIEKI